MNPKLRDLQIQAFAECKTFEDGQFRTDEVFERFAELIVRECARISRATPCPYTDELMRQQLGHTWDMASSEAGREIMQHFGVRE